MYTMYQKVYVNVYKMGIANLDELLGGAEVTCHELFGNANDDSADGTPKSELKLTG
jgi:hypothetical protein